MAFHNVYRNKKVLITGNTGFKGSWLSTWLLMLGADVYGYSIDIPTQPSMFQVLDLENKLHNHFGDVRNKEELNNYIQQVTPDFIFHLAAQAIVSTSYAAPFDTITTNVVGTASVLESICNITWPCTCILITSDKAYNNVEWIWGYREVDALGGKDVYSGSKGAAELIIKCYWNSFIQKIPHIKLGIARAGNVIGGGDWAKDRIIVDCINAFVEDKEVEIRCPNATRPWQHVLEPLSGYLTLGQYLHEDRVDNGEPFNFGPRAEQTKTVFELVQKMAKLWEKKSENIVKITDNIPFNEATLLKLNCDKALAFLNWHSTFNYEQCVQFIVDWYRSFYIGNKIDMYQLTLKQIEEYILEAEKQHLDWTI
ncbi:cDP-glucose 4 6-dehydratase [Bacteroides clarus CAG:160]|jgi:CDP-glucose 4,6-dehydratase|uniref:CDP-glucose 4,6-dehydratase n=1 Tax=Bacteroides TaxID=816 RepID=UPI00033D2A0C|nr:MULTISPECIES: CDP-glucose 4,6-dehydratase [Bacteroides]CDB83985.1 cDP-glucose 4 6-dehydratase [Bacteroides clarus CAG:160]